MNRSDVIGFVEMLHNIAQNTPIDLMLTTGGGDVDACEKLVKLIAAKKVDQPLRVIVPNLAKSAGTLMLLGADRIIMSDSSEIGMIDPQFPMRDGRGNEFMYSVMGYLDAFAEHTEALRRKADDPVALLMLDSFDARTVWSWRRVRRFSYQCRFQYKYEELDSFRTKAIEFMGLLGNGNVIGDAARS